MQEFTIETGEWKAFWERWRNTIDKVPGLKEQLLNQVGARVRREVLNAIETSSLNDSHGRVKRWQNPHKGSGKGYVAVRPDSVKVPAGYRRKSNGSQSEELNAGALTTFLTSGHRVRGPSGRTERYQPKARMTRVKGLDFYSKAQAEAEKIAIEEAKILLREIKELVGL